MPDQTFLTMQSNVDLSYTIYCMPASEKSNSKGALTLSCNLCRNLSRNFVATQVVSEIARCNMPRNHKVMHKVESSFFFATIVATLPCIF